MLICSQRDNCAPKRCRVKCEAVRSFWWPAVHQGRKGLLRRHVISLIKPSSSESMCSSLLILLLASVLFRCLEITVLPLCLKCKVYSALWHALADKWGVTLVPLFLSRSRRLASSAALRGGGTEIHTAASRHASRSISCPSTGFSW